MNINNLKLERKNLRISFTSCTNKVTEELAKRELDLKILFVLETQLKDKFARLEDCQKNISGILFETQDSEQECEDDFKAAEEYRDKYLELKTGLERKITVSQIPDFGNSNEFIEKRNFKLPKIELKKFSGDAKEYLTFWSQFEKIHKDQSISESDKFQYLLQAVVPNSRAARVVDSFPATAANYQQAINQIKERFGREDLLVQVYIRDLLTMVMKNAIAGRVKTDLPKLYDELEGKLRSLESLGRTQEKYGDFLIPLVESILPEEVLISWERKRNCEESSGEERSLKKLMCFLKHEVQSEEMVALARSGFGANTALKRPERDTNKIFPTASSLVSTSFENTGKRIFSCIFCDKKHFSRDCFSARNMSLESKKKLLIKKNACFSCFKPNHTARACRIKNVCIKCKRFHHFLMCPDINVENFNDKKKDEIYETSTLTNNSNIENVYLMTLMVKVKNKDLELRVRVLIDSGSQNSYISRNVVENLHLVPKRKIKMTHCLFGGRETSVQMHNVYDIIISDLNDSFSCKAEVFSENKITGYVPKLSSIEALIELREKQIILPDLECEDTEINLLLGADLIGALFTNKCMKLDSGLFLLETRLGCVLTGKPKRNVNNNYNSDAVLSVISLYVKNACINELWDLETIGIRDPVENLRDRQEHSKILEEFKNNVKILPEGRYEVCLPFKSDTVELPSNKQMAWKRHKKMCERAENAGLLIDYEMVFREWEKLNMIERVTEDVEKGHFLPHRPVVKMDSATTKIRPVFDASAREYGKCSLNDILYKGPNLIEQIPDIIDRFRIYKIGLSADIEKAFLQINIDPEHRDFLRFYYPSMDEEIIYRHCRVVFGVSSSPFLLAASISHLLDNAPANYNKLAEKLKYSFYVDNCVTGVSNTAEQKEFIEQAKCIMSQGSFNLRNWESNVESQYVCKSSGVTKLLGILWDLDRDMLKCNLTFDKLSNEESFTKRLVLSSIQKIFDPVGMLCPATLPPKILLQQTWKLGLGWDSPLPDEIQRSFKKWFCEINVLENVQIPRYIEVNESTEMHVFMDACKEAYAACVFFRTVSPEGIKIQLVRAKARVAPIKPATIPRLELIACNIGARLAHSVQQALCVQNMKTVFWSDSMVSLYWLNDRGDWSVFVSNRVKEIKSLFPNTEWRHVPGKINPADLISRGCSPKQLLESRWWEGPLWLIQEKDKWPMTEISGCETAEISSERRKVKLCNVNISDKSIPWYARKFSKFDSIVRLAAWVLRFINNVKSRYSDRKKGKLSVEELEQAEETLISAVQNEFFPDVDSIPHLSCFKDEKGIIRIKTRITERIDTPYFLSPILLPDDCIFTFRLIEHFHVLNCHAGTHILLSILREKYWIQRGRKTVRKVVNKCIPCKRHKVKSRESDPVPLPNDRIKDSTVFEIVGADLAGPLFVKNADKAWIVLYTCAVYRAVHLELVSSLSTDAFLLSLRRFVARRGRPRVIYSDNGTNFRGAYNDMSKIDWNKITRFTDVKRIVWKFNPPSAAWWGGWWERIIRVIKELLRRTLGKAVLTFEELQTILCDCEATINSRPLTYQSENPEDLVPLTPSMFLVQNSNSNITDIDEVDANQFRKRLRYRANLLEQLRMRFRNEYLGQLIQRRRQTSQLPDLELGELVLIGDDVKKRLNWPLAKIIDLIPGRDGKVRTVKLKTQHGVIIRPIQRVFSLELTHNNYCDSTFQLENSVQDDRMQAESPGTQSAEEGRIYRTRFGRVSKVPQRLGK